MSVEGSGKTAQPLQFSFTFYDLDGHHGKITKDVSADLVLNLSRYTIAIKAQKNNRALLLNYRI